MNSNRKEARLVTRVLSALEIAALVFQAACARPRPIVSLTPETLIPPTGLVTPTPTPASTNTPKPTEKPTETPTPTPEWQSAAFKNISPNNPATWTGEFSRQADYWNTNFITDLNALIEKNRPLALAGDTEAWLAAFPKDFSPQMKEFDTFVRSARRSFLVNQLNLKPADVEKMTDEAVRWQVIKWGIENKQMVLITPIEDIQFLTGQGINDLNYNPSILACQGSNREIRQDGLYAGKNLILNQGDFQWNLDRFNTLQYTIPIWGKETTIPHPVDVGVAGRLLLISPIPGISPEIAVKAYTYYQDNGIINSQDKDQYGIYPVFVNFQPILGKKGDYYVDFDNDGVHLLFTEQDGWEYHPTGRTGLEYITFNELITALGGGIRGGDSGRINDNNERIQIGGGRHPNEVYPMQLGLHAPFIVGVSLFSSDYSYPSLFPWEQAAVISTPTP